MSTTPSSQGEEGMFTMTPGELGSLVGAAVGSAVGEQQRLMANSLDELRKSVVEGMNDMRGRVMVLAEALGGMDRHNAERQQQLWAAMEALSRCVEGAVPAVGEGAEDAEGTGTEPWAANGGLGSGVRFNSGRLVMPVPGDGGGGQDSDSSEAN